MDSSRDEVHTRDLVAAAQNGDRQAFATLVLRYRSRLEFLARMRLGPRLRQAVDVDDILQEAFLRALKSIPQFQWRGEGSFYRWLGSIVEHVVLDHARRVRLQQPALTSPPGRNGTAPSGSDLVSLENLLVGKSPSPTQVLRRKERFERLEAAFNDLSQDYREVIVLALVRDLPIKEVAERMGRSPDAISMLLLRALRRLRGLFGSTGSLHLPPFASLDVPTPALNPLPPSRDSSEDDALSPGQEAG